ncbi:uncharacterized protein LOC119670584 [Teleopsis dalmanni]|uniref:uncharacterized protein LOC119670584 n=1 Tax=Teleopsis dalmanni TaxID=139649 RepID=UPI0018CE3474|nr:uncharacterized protein LOC119670584 [Teleopsis dalmanni]XP_037936826.1 uncharacterized protein LOC119670584 [Teleopsis dalmanni]
MPSGVYQPTTVSYETRNGSGPLGLLGPTSSVDSPLRVFRKPRPQVALLVFGVISLAAGIAMLTSSIADWMEGDEYDTTQSENDISTCEPSLGLLLGGVFMSCVGFTAIGMYIKVADWRRNCVCPCPLLNKKQTLARQLQSQSNGECGQGAIALNPSTDPLVSHTQYAPVSELPSLRADDEERRNLMPDSKDCLSSAEESDRMLEPDPRIVLRPMGRVEDA